MKKPFSSLSTEEVQFFLTYKESQYAIRRKRIEDFCSIQDENFGRKIIKNSLIFDKDDKISYCQIAKVASSSWCNHFIKLANVSDKERYRWRDALQVLAPTLWPQPSQNLLEEWHDEQNLSIVIVRHPLSRLASVYYQKFVELSAHKSWSKLISSIIARYRPSGQTGPSDRPTPTEYVRYILDDLGSNPRSVDQHWRPQHRACPFCLLQFNVYAHMEELHDDSLYFFKKSELIEKVNFEKILNSAHDEDSTEERFWTQVEPKLLPKLNMSWSYKNDFEMFDYSFDQYLQNFNIEL